jgi:hypothetical protein
VNGSAKSESVTPDLVVHIGLTPAIKGKLDQMVKLDRRSKAEWIRMMIEDEWDRRQKGAQP